MSSFPMAPLFRQSVGFDRFNDLFESALRNDTGSSYPPYNIADHIEVKGAALNSGLLHIDLVRVVPEEAKPKRIPINADQRPALEG